MTLLLLALNLLDLEKLALAQNAAYQQAVIQLRIAEGQRQQAGLYPNPSIGFNSEHNSPNPAVRWGSNGGFLSQRIVTGNKRGIEKAIADREVDEARARRDLARFELTGHLRRLYYQALGEQQSLAVREQLAKTATETAGVFRQLLNTGLADEPDVLAADVEAQRAEVRLSQARLALARTRQQLTALVQQELGAEPLDGDFFALPALERAAVWSLIEAENPEFTLPGISIRRSELQLAQARQARIPDVFARGGVRYNRELSEITRGAIGPEGIFDLSVELPLFNRQQGAIAAAKAMRARAALEPARVRRSVDSRFAEVWQAYEQARTAAQRYQREMLPATEKALTLYRANYKAMSGTYPNVLQTQRTYFQLQEEYLETLQSGWAAVAVLDARLVSYNP
ncbi:MAG: TolC family protein [Acidobacteriaceae bacterium]|nr:TolC family protein [Acidobacteriaceae bacterium]